MFWIRQKRWVWGNIFKTTTNGDALQRRYTVRLNAVYDEDGFNADFFIENVNCTQLKKRKAFFKGDKSEENCLYFSMKDLSIEPIVTNGQRETSVPIPTCGCFKCMFKYKNKIKPDVAKTMFSTFHTIGLKKGSIITVKKGIEYEEAEIIELFPCADPKYSYFKVNTFESNSKFKLNAKHTWCVYNIEFNDGTWKPYHAKDSFTVVSHIFNNFIIDKSPYTKFTHAMNDYVYEIDVQLDKIVWNTDNIQIVGTQRNTTTNVVREIRFVRVQKPKAKTIKDFKEVIERKMGKHEGVWLNKEDTEKRFRGSILHDGYKLLGCFKLNRADNKKTITERLAFYKSHGIECKIKKLFHGTYQKNLYPILHPMGGFAMASETNGKAYGHGIYFASQPKYCINNGYAPAENDNLRCIIACDVIVGKTLDSSTDSDLKNADVRTGNSSNSIAFHAKKFALTGGSSSGTITVVFYDKIQTDIHITEVLWYR